jgi:plasmid stabilization system protein ParE
MEASPKLQRAGRTFLLRLVAENGPEEAARILRDIASEIKELAEDPMSTGITPLDSLRRTTNRPVN